MKIIAMFDHYEQVGPGESQVFREAKSFEGLDSLAAVVEWAEANHGRYQNITIVIDRHIGKDTEKTKL